jgi:L-threonylcarbamoyladenylate synthase
MEIIDKGGFERRHYRMIEEMRNGKVFVYPTDTIYGIGCDATNPTAVERIRTLKKRVDKPFSVIAPSIEWIMSNCDVRRSQREWIERLPGPYTFILKLSNKDAVSQSVNGGLSTLGVRMPANWFALVVAESGIPFVTTSVNLTGKPFMTSLKDISPKIRDGVDYIVDVGELKNKPSKVIDLASGSTVRD